MEEIGMAIVGLGPRAVGTWIPLLDRIPGFRIVAIHDPIGRLVDRARETLARPDAVRVAASYEEVLADPGVDAVGLTVRCEDQGAMAADALEAGKHVHAEVPAAHTIDDCRRIARAVERTGRVYQLAEQTRYWGFVEAWRELVAAGRLGTVTLAEAQYLHYLPEAMFVDPDTGEKLGPGHPDARPSWSHRMPPIHYLPHSLGPILRILDDRVVEVVAMGTDPPSRAHPDLDQPDLQTALMKTARGAVLRMTTSFAQPHPEGDWHWYQVVGTGGRVEWKRARWDRPRKWLAGGPEHDMAEADWRYERADAPPEAAGSGHGDADYYTHLSFRDAVLAGRQPAFDVYQALDTAAPAILAATSIAEGGIPQTVPDFRPR
jgi:predicted dehydrogenase